MTKLVHAVRHLSPRGHRARLAHNQQGIVLIIALVMLIIISMLAVTTLRNAGSSENISSNVRTTELASQAAEIALRYCEYSVAELTSSAGPYTTTFPVANILPVSTTPRWQSTTLWDSASTGSTLTFALPLSELNQSGMAMTTYQRPPECMVEEQPTALAGTTTVSTTLSYVITARGFGPEVPALTGSTRIRPAGSEVWMQSTIGF